MEYFAAGGRFGIGSDSHVIVDAVEELRLIEYGQRLSTRRRNLLARNAHASTGTSLYLDAVDGGAQALGRCTTEIAVGQFADLVVLDGDAPILAGKTGSDITDTFVFSGSGRLAKDIYVRGQKVISDRHHAKKSASPSDIARRCADYSMPKTKAWAARIFLCQLVNCDFKTPD